MSFEQTMEDKIHHTERKMKELSLRLEKINCDYQKILEEIALTPHQLKTYIENSENFTPPIWEQLQNDKKKIDEKLNLELSRVKDPLKNKQTYSENGFVRPHWLFVR